MSDKDYILYLHYANVNQPNLYYGLTNSRKEYAQIKVAFADRAEIRDMVSIKLRQFRKSGSKIKKLRYDEFYSNVLVWDWTCKMQAFGKPA